MPRLQLVHWDAEEAKRRAVTLRNAGYQVTWAPSVDRASLDRLKKRPPAAFVIDLSKRPSQGRDLGLALRLWKSTRHVPLVFVEGERDGVAAVRRQLPDATFTTWRRIRGAVRLTLASPPKAPVVPASAMAGYTGAPLSKKLGIKPHTVVVLIGAPKNVERILGLLPDGVSLRRRDVGVRHLTLWFVKRQNDLEQRIDRVASNLGAGGLWIVWPKQSSALADDLTQTSVRRIGLAHGLVDFKVCAIDADWSGLRFVRRASRVRRR